MKMRKAATKKVAGTSNKVIHHVTVLDASGSMRGANYNSAVDGINEGVNALKIDDSGVRHTYTMVEFSGGGWSGHSDDIKNHTSRADVNAFTWKPMGASGMTPLVRTCINVIEEMMKGKPQNEPCLLNIFTDGGENCGGNWLKLSNLIDEAEKNHAFTITFRGTEADIVNVRRQIKLKTENIMTHDNTSRSIKASFDTTTAQTMRFAKSYAGGASLDSLTQNFYTRTDEDVNNKK